MTASSAAVARARAERWRLFLARTRGFTRRYIGRIDGVIGLAILVLFAVLALAPEQFVGPLQTATTATGEGFSAPSIAHVLGTDELGRDMLNLTVHGARISMTIGLLATVITIVVGVLVGIVAGYVGGLADSVLMRI